MLQRIFVKLMLALHDNAINTNANGNINGDHACRAWIP